VLHRRRHNIEPAVENDAVGAQDEQLNALLRQAVDRAINVVLGDFGKDRLDGHRAATCVNGSRGVEDAVVLDSTTRCA
jgi:hypothetical protein